MPDPETKFAVPPSFSARLGTPPLALTVIASLICRVSRIVHPASKSPLPGAVVTEATVGGVVSTVTACCALVAGLPARSETPAVTI